jgi:hypothetical protein
MKCDPQPLFGESSSQSPCSRHPFIAYPYPQNMPEPTALPLGAPGLAALGLLRRRN